MIGSSEFLQPAASSWAECEPGAFVRTSICLWLQTGLKGHSTGRAAGYLKGHSRRNFTVFVAFETQGIPVTRDLERPES